MTLWNMKKNTKNWNAKDYEKFKKNFFSGNGKNNSAVRKILFKDKNGFISERDWLIKFHIEQITKGKEYE